MAIEAEETEEIMAIKDKAAIIIEVVQEVAILRPYSRLQAAAILFRV